MKEAFYLYVFFLIFYFFFFFWNDTWRGGGTDGAQSDVTAEGERAEVPQYCRLNKGTFIINFIFQYSIASWDVVADLPWPSVSVSFLFAKVHKLSFFSPMLLEIFSPTNFTYKMRLVDRAKGWSLEIFPNIYTFMHVQYIHTEYTYVLSFFFFTYWYLLIPHVPANCKLVSVSIQRWEINMME